MECSKSANFQRKLFFAILVFTSSVQLLPDNEGSSILYLGHATTVQIKQVDRQLE